MRKFIFKIVLFGIPFLFAFVALEFFFRHIPNNYSVKNQYIKVNNFKIETVLFGDSHCLYGLNPNYFSSYTFNLSNVSQTIYFDQLLFEKHINHLPALKQVVFCIEYTNLSQKDNTGEDNLRKFFYERYMHLNVPSILKYDPKRFSILLTQDFHKTKDLVKRYIKTGTIVDCDAKGWGTNYTHANRIKPESIAERRAQVQEDGSTDFRLNARRLQEMISTCQKRNIQVVIVSMPQTRIYEHYLNQNKLKAIIKKCSDFQVNNPETVHYLNLFHDERFTNDDFFDADHLNNVGAVKCSKIVNQFLNTIDTKE
jgi:hypothetical protein